MAGSVRRHGWWVGAAVGLVAAGVVGAGAQVWQEQREADDLTRAEATDREWEGAPEPVDTVRDILEQDSPLAVHPDLVDRIDADTLEQARQVLADADQSPVRRVAYVPRADGLETGYSPFNALAQWMKAVGEEGHYVMVFEGGTTQIDAIGLEPQYLDAGAKGQPGPALLRIATEVADWPAEPVMDRRDRLAGRSDEWGGAVGGAVGGVLIASVTVVPAWGVAYFVSWRRGQRRDRELTEGGGRG